MLDVPSAIEDIHAIGIRGYDGLDLTGHSTFHEGYPGIIRSTLNRSIGHIGDEPIRLG
jgi:hypothetical protein